ncbi:hypothetical protein PROFUN_03721 [Planoprotostelium fungivorum]|uniref:Glycosyl transferase family 1 domain-containing protein n=1 Tax=Planoprotostelium fungivorum TaxID=1890364 RepID=A0A2P6NDM4_9EUKA|nr:hypothetical protein PROFUN_03721 [Planoprotostelium fungivorum]
MQRSSQIGTLLDLSAVRMRPLRVILILVFLSLFTTILYTLYLPSGELGPPPSIGQRTTARVLLSVLVMDSIERSVVEKNFKNVYKHGEGWILRQTGPQNTVTLNRCAMNAQGAAVLLLFNEDSFIDLLTSAPFIAPDETMYNLEKSGKRAQMNKTGLEEYVRRGEIMVEEGIPSTGSMTVHVKEGQLSILSAGVAVSTIRKSLIPLGTHQFGGIAVEDEYISSISHGLIINKEDFIRVKGYDPKLEECRLLQDVDLTLRMIHKSRGRPSQSNATLYMDSSLFEKIYAPNCPAREHFEQSEEGTSMRSDRERNDYFPIRYQMDLGVEWEIPCGCSALSREAMRLISVLERRIKIYTNRLNDDCKCPSVDEVSEAVERARNNERKKQILITYEIPKERNHKNDYASETITQVKEALEEKRIDEYWVPSDWMRASYIKGGCAPDKMKVVPILIDTNIFDPEIAPSLHRSGLNATHFDFLVSFPWTQGRNWEELEMTKFDEKGAVHPHLGLSTKLQTERKANNVIVHEEDNIAYDQLPSLYKSFGCYISPYQQEGWGIEMQQSMAMGMPTIAVDHSGYLDYMNRNNSYLIPPTFVSDGAEMSISVPLLRRTMRRIFNNPGRAAKIGKAARKTIVEKFSLRVAETTILKRLEEIEDKIV